MSQWDAIREMLNTAGHHAADTSPKPVVRLPREKVAIAIRAEGVPHDLRDVLAAWVAAGAPTGRIGRPPRPFTGHEGEATTFAHWNLVHCIACHVAVRHAERKVKGVPHGRAPRDLAIEDAARAYNKSTSYVKDLLRDVRNLPPDWQKSIPDWRTLAEGLRKGGVKDGDTLSPPSDGQA